MKLGKLKPTYDRRDFHIAKYLKLSKLPEIPEQFGHEGTVENWRMLGNDRLGNCVFAGAAHETMLLSALGGNGKVFNDKNTIGDYSAVTGYDPKRPNETDNGAFVRDALEYRRNVGVMDAFGARHKINAYLSLEPGNIPQLRAALYLFGVVGIGIEFPNSAMDQHQNGLEVWTVRPGAQIEGGHYVPLVGWRENLVCVTWGSLQEMSLQFFQTYCDESWAIVSDEFLQEGKSPEGFDWETLMEDLAAL